MYLIYFYINHVNSCKNKDVNSEDDEALHTFLSSPPHCLIAGGGWYALLPGLVGRLRSRQMRQGRL